MQPTYRALLLFAAGLVLAGLPAVGGPKLWLAWLAYVGLVVLVTGVDAVLCPAAARLESALEAPPLLFMGARHEAALHLALPVRGSVAAEARIDTSGTLDPLGPWRCRLSRRGRTLRVALRARRRGPAGLEALWVRYEGPLGLVRRTVRRTLGERLRAVPNIRFVSGEGLRLAGTPQGPAGLKVERHPGDGSEFDSLREFVAGLDHRTIDWKASARHTRLLSRDVRAERNHQIVLGVDTGRLMAEPVAGLPLLDHAIHAALLLAFVSLRAGDRVRLFPFAERPRTLSAPRAGLSAMPSLLELAGGLEYSTAETNFTLALTELASRLRRRSLIVVLTDFVDSVTAELMVENLFRLRRRHVVIFVAFRDPVLEGLFDAEPRTMLDLDRAVVSASLIEERDLVVKRLAREGVYAIDVHPDLVGPRLVNRYLEIKRRELI